MRARHFHERLVGLSEQMLRKVDRHIDGTGADARRVAHLQAAKIELALGLAVVERKQKLFVLKVMLDRSLRATVEAGYFLHRRMQSAKLFQVDRGDRHRRPAGFLRFFLSRHSRRPLIPKVSKRVVKTGN